MIYAETLPMTRLMKSMKCGYGYRGGDPRSCAEAMLRLAAADYGQLARSGRHAVEEGFNWDVDARKLVGFIMGLMERAQA